MSRRRGRARGGRRGRRRTACTRLPPDDRGRRSPAWARRRRHREPARRGGAGRSPGRRSRRAAASTRDGPGACRPAQRRCRRGPRRVSRPPARSTIVHSRPASAPWSGRSHWLRGDTASCIDVARGGADARRRPADGSGGDRGHRQPGVHHRPARAVRPRPSHSPSVVSILARDHGLADREVRCLNARGAAVLLQGNIEGYNDFMRALTRALEAGLGHESAMAYHNLAELQLQGVGTASSIETERARPRPRRASRAHARRRLAAGQPRGSCSSKRGDGTKHSRSPTR